MEEGFVICEKCKGRGTLDINEDPISYVRPCPKCLGVGKLDWIENVVGKRIRINKSCLDDINVRRLSEYIKKTIQKTITITYPRDSSVSTLTRFLEELRRRKAFYDYYIRWQDDSDVISLTIKPNRTTESISIDYNIT